MTAARDRGYSRPSPNVRTPPPPRVLQMAAENRKWAAMAGPVVRVQAARCDCGAWMRPGVDHECARPAWAHEVRHITGQPARCSCGWATAGPIPVPWVEVFARGHLLNR